jgi:hypothetical protein
MNESTQVELMIYGRLSYTYVHEPFVNRKDPTKKPTYCTHVLLDPNDPGDPRLGIKSGAEYIAMVRDAQRGVAQRAWKDWESMLPSLAHKDKLALHDGKMCKPKEEHYHGKLFLSANNKNRPTLVESRGGKNVPLVAADNRPYSGCWGVVHVAIYAQSPDGRKSEHGERINVQLMGVQFVKHDSAFGGGGRVSTPDEFGIVAAEADAALPAQAQAAAAGGASLF